MKGPKQKKKHNLTIINTNARSLCPKIDSLVTCFTELEVDLAVITETWLKDGPQLDTDLDDLDKGAGLKTITLNRQPHPTTGVAHGGVAIMYRGSVGSFKRINIPNPDHFEVLPAIGTLRGSSKNCDHRRLYTSQLPGGEGPCMSEVC